MTAADILGALLRTNLAATAAVLGVIALRKPARPRFGARLAYGLWLLPLLAGAAVLIPARQVVIVRTAAPVFDTAARVHQTVWTSGLTPPPAGAAPAAAMSLDPPMLLLGLWLAGVAGAALFMIHLQHRFVRAADGGGVGPAVVGVIAPRIVTPEDFGERYSRDEQALVLAHEQAHIARQDSRLNGLTAAFQCLCWFNPLVHLAARLMRIDQELACDEAVVARFPAARRAYAEVLVKAQLAILPLPLGCYWPSKTQHPLVERVAMLKLKTISRARRWAGVSGLAILGAGAGLAAWAAQPADVRIAVSAARDAAVAPPAADPRPAAAPKPMVLAQAQAKPPASASPATAPGATTANPSPEDAARLLAEQQQPRQVAPFDPAHFDRYVGYYQLAPTAIFHITRDGAKFFTQLTGQQPVEVFPESETKFFATVVAAQVSFAVDAQGVATGLVLHQNGREQPAPRIDEAKGKAFGAALAQRILSNTPSPGTEAFLRRYLESQEAGAPDYSAMTPGLAQAARAQQDRLTNDIKTWGALQSIQFNGVMPQGQDRYTVTFKNAEFPVVVAPIGPDGKAGGLLFMPQAGMQPPSPEVAARMKDNRPSPGTEASVRKWLAALEAGQPNYEDMAPALADAARQQWPQTIQRIKAAGALKDVRFVRVDPQGADIYEADFDNVRILVSICPLTADGKVWGRSWQVLP